MRGLLEILSIIFNDFMDLYQDIFLLSSSAVTQRAAECRMPSHPTQAATSYYAPNLRTLDWKSLNALRKSTFLNSTQFMSRKKNSE